MEDRKSPSSILYLQSSTFSGWLVFFIGGLLDLWHRHPSLNRRPSRYRVVPAFHVRKFLQLHLMHLVAPYPRVRGNIGNRIFASEVFLLAELLIQDFVKPQRFFVITLDGVGDFLGQTKEK